MEVKFREFTLFWYFLKRFSKCLLVIKTYKIYETWQKLLSYKKLLLTVKIPKQLIKILLSILFFPDCPTHFVSCLFEVGLISSCQKRSINLIHALNLEECNFMKTRWFEKVLNFLLKRRQRFWSNGNFQRCC